MVAVQQEPGGQPEEQHRLVGLPRPERRVDEVAVLPRREGINHHRLHHLHHQPSLQRLPGMIATIVSNGLVHIVIESDAHFIDWSDSPPPAPAPAPARAPSRAAAPRSAQSSHANSAAPQCDCGMTAAERTVTKESANKGRKFWTCGDNQTCQFFQWFDGPSNSSNTFASTSRAPSASSSAVPAKRPFNSIGSSANVGSERRCQCDLTPVLKETTTGANKGKKFWSCPNQSRQAQCRYFEWALDDDAGPSAAPRRSYSTSSNNPASYDGGGGGGGSSGECFQCGEEGHWASGRAAMYLAMMISSHAVLCPACPNNGAGAKRTKSHGDGGGGGASSSACFKCGEDGHFSSGASQCASSALSICSSGSSQRVQLAVETKAVLQGMGMHASSAANRGITVMVRVHYMRLFQGANARAACPGGGGGSVSRKSSTSRGGKRGRGRGRGGKSGTRGRKKSTSSFSAADDYMDF